MVIRTIRTGSTLVSSAVPDRSTHRSPVAYTGLFQKRSKRILLPVKCFYVMVGGHKVLIDAGWSKEVVSHPIRHLGFGLWFASEPVMKPEEAASSQLQGNPVDAIFITHMDSDHASGLKDFEGIPIYVSEEEVRYTTKDRLRYGKLAKGYDYTWLNFCEDRQAPFGLSSDVFNDGSIIAYLTPTHSAGSVIYKIVDDGKYALIVGDNAYMERSWVEGILPGPLFSIENEKRILRWF